MRLANPWALALIPIAWALAGAVLWRGRAAAISYPAGELARAAPRSRRALFAVVWTPILSALALTFAAVALARPQSVSALVGDDGRGVDIVLAIDSSGSMRATDLAPTRLGAAKEIAKSFINGRVSDRIGLVTFGGAPLLACPPTTDYDSLRERLDELEPEMTKVDGTAIGDGLVAAGRRLKDLVAKSKVVVLLTDGRSNTGAVDPITAAKTLATLGIKIYAIGSAGRGPATLTVDDPRQGRVTVQINDDLDEELLAQIADITGGKSYRAQNRGELQKIFSEIDRLEKREVRRPPVIAVADHHVPALAFSGLLLLLESALAATVFLRWP